MRRIDHDVTTSTLFRASRFRISTIMVNRSGEKHGVRWGGWVARSKRVTTPRALGGLGSLTKAHPENDTTPHLKNGGRGRAQWPGRKIPPANINPPYVWLRVKKGSHSGTLFVRFYHGIHHKPQKWHIPGGLRAVGGHFSQKRAVTSQRWGVRVPKGGRGVRGHVANNS